MQVFTNYQYSKLIERTARLNGGDATLAKAISPDDQPQCFVANGSWNLPFGNGKRFGVSSGTELYLGGTQPRNVGGVFDVTRFERDSTKQLSNNLRTFADRFPICGRTV